MEMNAAIPTSNHYSGMRLGTLIGLELKSHASTFYLLTGTLLVAYFAMIVFWTVSIGILAVISLGLFIAGTIMIGSRQDDDKRDRIMTVLPVKPWAWALTRLVPFITLQLVLFLIWSTQFILPPSMVTPADYPELIALAGNMLVITMLVIINSDLGHFFTIKYRIYLVLLILLLLTVGLLYGAPLLFTYNLENSNRTLGESLLHNLFWLLLVPVSIWIYGKRRSYVK